MGRRVTVLITIVCLLVCSCASYTIQLIERQEMMENPDYKIAAVITKAGEYLEFDPDAVLKDTLIVGWVSDGPSISMNLSNVDSIYVRKEVHLDEESRQARLRTTGCIIGASLVIGVIIAIVLWINSLDIGQ